MKYGIDTRCQHLADDNKDEIYGAISYPIYQSATFARDRVGGGSGYDYSRLQNPTREHLEKIVASLEEGIDALAFSTGMAAITALMEIFKPGDHIIIDEDLYGGSIRLFHSINVKNGLTFTSVDLSSVDVEDYIQDNTKAIYAETPTNPMMRVSDLEELSKIAKKHELLLIVDNTFLSPYFQNPLKLGADIVVHSGTKYLGGHNDTLAGFLITNREDIQEQLRFIIKTTGATLAPMDSWLILRGIKTLGVRMDRAQENALKIAHFLEKQEYVTRVLYPGLESHPGYELMKKQAKSAEDLRIAEFNSLQAQINPHFLYNTMDMINWMALQGQTEEISHAVQSLSRFYKLTLSRKKGISTIARELEHVTIYVQLQNMRYHDSIELITDIPDELSEYQIPKLTLQPVVENSILHGILEKESKSGTIVITGWMENEDIVLLISDDGVGISPEILSTILSGSGNSQSGGTNIAVYNTHRRLQILYGKDYGLTYSSNPGKGTEVEIRFPAHREE